MLLFQVGAEIPPEILNNVGALLFRQGLLEESRDHFDKALNRTKEEGSDDDTYYSQIAISIRSVGELINFKLLIKCDPFKWKRWQEFD